MAKNRITTIERDWFALLVLAGLCTEAEALAARRRMQESAWDEFKRLQGKTKKRRRGRE